MSKIIPSIQQKLRSYSLTITAVIALNICLLLTLATLINLVVKSTEKARAIRVELFDRDLREIAGRFDADERFVLDRNLNELLSSTRAITPLLLPRQYYIALPSGRTPITPRQPPRNCYVDLVPTVIVPNENALYPDRFCAYFADNPAFGRFLFLSISFVDSYITPLDIGDPQLLADAIGIEITTPSNIGSWWLAIQNPKKTTADDRYELTSFRRISGNAIERDKRIEGWAYTQRQANGEQVVTLVARMDIRAFIPDIATKDTQIQWPPSNWKDTKLRITRRNTQPGDRIPKIISYQSTGITNLSISSLATPFFNSYATPSLIERTQEGKLKVWTVPPPNDLGYRTKAEDSYIRFVDGDLLIKQSPIIKEQLIPDTSLSFSARHPGTVIEKSVWQTTLLLSILLLGFVAFAAYFSLQVLRPIWRLSRQSRNLLQGTLTTKAELPYSELTNEIGTLARGFNELLREIRAQTEREIEERERRTERERLESVERVRAREENLKIIGHEIRSPLQALSVIHKPGSPGRHHVDRMIRAITNLFGTVGPEATFNSVPISPEPLDLATFLYDLRVNAIASGEFQDIDYIGPSNGTSCLVDPGVLEDAITNILSNAVRHRTPKTLIKISLSVEKNSATISICNKGEKIPADLHEKIFDLYFSMDQVNDPSRQGIGLYSARNYISRMSGNISVRNIVDGVCFDIHLPLIENSLPT